MTNSLPPPPPPPPRPRDAKAHRDLPFTGSTGSQEMTTAGPPGLLTGVVITLAAGFREHRSAHTRGRIPGALACWAIALVLLSPSLAAAQATVNGVDIVSHAWANGHSYQLDEEIIVRVSFSQDVTVTGSPQLALKIGSTTRQAGFTDESFGNLRFLYRVVASDRDTDGISIAADALTLNGERSGSARRMRR